jgi:hypothetical protein
VLTGKKFRLNRPTLAIEIQNGQTEAITVPAGAELMVLSGPHPDSDQLTQLQWGDRRIAMFSIAVTTQVKEGPEDVKRSG